MTSGNSPLYDEARQRVALSTVGFLTIGDKPDEVGSSIGSGTLASIGPTSGVVTAAHVLGRLREHERVGIAHFIPPEGRDQRGIVVMDRCGDVQFEKGSWQETGPDLAFLVLPYDLVGSLKAVGCVFMNLDRRGEAIRKEEYDKRGFWFVAGAVAERTLVAGNDGNRVVVSVEASVEPGDVSNFPLADGFDGYRFVPTPHPSYTPPSSYGGMSGGGLWIGHTADGEDAESDFSSLSFVGVNFWQSDVGGQGRSIVCHGPDGIYRRLHEAVHAKFA